MSKEPELLEVFISRPTWVSEELKPALDRFYGLLEDLMMYPNTIGISQPCLQTPFNDIIELMTNCKCAIIFALPQMFIEKGKIKDQAISDIALPTEWNQIETAIALSLKKPTLIILHEDVSPRGLLEIGAANVYIHKIKTSDNTWPNNIRQHLEHLIQTAKKANQK